ncbi:hypothetical protein RUM44_005900 [Polyplax serrata]|uniref:Uncharacterized protein n=1 Tax=Polyplax serrata TaxID=468196 RepID=A0ABR1AYE6_POLSC
MGRSVASNKITSVHFVVVEPEENWGSDVSQTCGEEIRAASRDVQKEIPSPLRPNAPDLQFSVSAGEKPTLPRKTIESDDFLWGWKDALKPK